MAAYHNADIEEYWVIDARDDHIRFDIFKHGKRGLRDRLSKMGWLGEVCQYLKAAGCDLPRGKGQRTALPGSSGSRHANDSAHKIQVPRPRLSENGSEDAFGCSPSGAH